MIFQYNYDYARFSSIWEIRSVHRITFLLINDYNQISTNKSKSSVIVKLTRKMTREKLVKHVQSQHVQSQYNKDACRLSLDTLSCAYNWITVLTNMLWNRRNIFLTDFLYKTNDVMLALQLRIIGVWKKINNLTNWLLIRISNLYGKKC